MKTSYLVLMFIVVAGLQLYIPAKMILDREDVIKQGKLFKFKTEPIDPNDPFRGKYITLRYEMERSYPVDDKSLFKEEVYVVLKEDENGFAQVDKLLPSRPESGDFIVAEKARYMSDGAINFNIPFDRFYMEESKAPKAEVAYNEVNQNGKEAYALIYVLDGDAVLHDVIIEGKSIADYVD